jgi:hypothetical protein
LRDAGGDDNLGKWRHEEMACRCAGRPRG